MTKYIFGREVTWFEVLRLAFIQGHVYLDNRLCWTINSSESFGEKWCCHLQHQAAAPLFSQMIQWNEIWTCRPLNISKNPQVFLKLSFVFSAIHSTFLCGILHTLQVHTEKALKVSGVSQRRRTGYENKVVQTGNKNLELFGYKDIQNPPLQCIYFQTYWTIEALTLFYSAYT